VYFYKQKVLVGFLEDNDIAALAHFFEQGDHHWKIFKDVLVVYQALKIKARIEDDIQEVGPSDGGKRLFNALKGEADGPVEGPLLFLKQVDISFLKIL
jgi:hypothetical protein